MSQPQNQAHILPGLSLLTTEPLSPRLFLLLGPAGAGKTMYCRQFLVDGIANKQHCVFVSSSLNEREFQTLFLNQTRTERNNLVFIDASNRLQAASIDEDQTSVY